jgi:hypothetical protein
MTFLFKMAFLFTMKFSVPLFLRVIPFPLSPPFPYDSTCMKTRLLAEPSSPSRFAWSALSPVVTAAPAPVANPADCANLTTLKLPDVKITEAAAVPAATTGIVRVPHCRVAGVIGTRSTSRCCCPTTGTASS